jgi:hypothetical protein
MLPGFRFLFAAIILSISLVVFGLGAAALLRAAHEEFASNPSWRAAPEVMFAQPSETTKPVLAMLSVDMPAAEKVQDDAPASKAPAEQTTIASAPTEPDRIAALKPEDSPPAETATTETAKPEIPVTESPASGEAMPALSQAPASAGATKVAAIAAGEVASPENQTVQPRPEPMAAPAAPGADIAATKIATLGGPPVSIVTPPRAKVSDPKPDDESAIRKRQQARRAAQRRRLAARARLAAQAAVQPAPFGQPSAPAVPTRTR